MVKVVCVLHLHNNVAFTFKSYGNTERFIPEGFELGTTLRQPNGSIVAAIKEGPKISHSIQFV